MENVSIDLIYDKLQSIESKVDREIHGGNGKGLWEETREIKKSVDTVNDTVHQLSAQLSRHTGQHLGKEQAEEMAKQAKHLKYISFGLILTVLGTLITVIRLLVIH